MIIMNMNLPEAPYWLILRAILSWHTLLGTNMVQVNKKEIRMIFINKVSDNNNMYRVAIYMTVCTVYDVDLPDIPMRKSDPKQLFYVAEWLDWTFFPKFIVKVLKRLEATGNIQIITMVKCCLAAEDRFENAFMIKLEEFRIESHRQRTNRH